ncbi:glycosyltransferase family 2 protein [Chryseobacterium kwangjuense]|uniref:Glycosyltransferase n=1 Tax=Chryseobacterium kwangjuense TaxID=267125 RepID=A0A135WDP0_9FLAO|nr:glycosyltransferase family 2 protein [Chryseobacterium kwangjuense]KXH83009.1 glycosyltransferase [Chryseobacterium kwangjuense]
MISIVSPVYRAENILPLLVSEIDAVMSRIGVKYEIILVDDRSPDNSWNTMQSLAKSHSNLRIFRLSRNFGQHPAIMAGISKAEGDWVVVMDCDLQDQPKEIEKLYRKALEGYDVVLARREIRIDSFFKKLSSRAFYKIFNYLAGIEINNEIANFGIYQKKVINAVLSINDNIKAFPLFVHWAGYNTTSVSVEHATREEGKSSYSFSRLVSLAFNVIISFSDKPLRIFVGFGVAISILSILVAVFFVVRYFDGKITEPGFSSLILSIWFLFGVTISCIGIVGIYVGKTFNQTKNRPVYIIDEQL